MMPMNRLKPVLKLLHDTGGDLHHLIVHAERLQRATQLLHACLDFPLSQHCQVANIKKNTIVIHTSSPAWAAKLRFHVAAILTNLRKDQGLGMLQSVRIKVSPIGEPVAPNLAERPIISKYAAEVINAAAHATADPELRDILLRLAQR